MRRTIIWLHELLLGAFGQSPAESLQQGRAWASIRAQLLLVVHDQGGKTSESLGRQACRAHWQAELDTRQQIVAAVPGMPIARDSISSGRHTAVRDQIAGAPVQVMDNIGGHGPYGAIPMARLLPLAAVPGGQAPVTRCSCREPCVWNNGSREQRVAEACASEARGADSMIVRSIRLRNQGFVIPAAAMLSALASVLTGCSSGSDGPSGEYYDKEGQLVIDGSSVAYYEFGCEKPGKSNAVIDSEATASGELSKDGGQVIWSDGKGTGKVTASKGGDTVDIDGKQYTKMDKAKALEGYQPMCG